MDKKNKTNSNKQNKKNKVTYAKISPKMVNPRDYRWGPQKKNGEPQRKSWATKKKRRRRRRSLFLGRSACQ